MENNLKKSAQIIQDALNQFGLDINIKEFADSTRTAQEAADSIGCKVEQIAKSIIFKCRDSKEPLLIIASGSNRIDEKKIREIVGQKLEKADAYFVLESTGFAIGGIPPIGHKKAIKTLIDEDLFKHEEIWAAAGTPNAVFKLTPAALLSITDGTLVAVK